MQGAVQTIGQLLYSSEGGTYESSTDPASRQQRRSTGTALDAGRAHAVPADGAMCGLDFAAGIVERWIFQLCTVSGSGGAAARNDSAAVGAVGAQAGGAHHDRQLCGAQWQQVLKHISAAGQPRNFDGKK